MHVASVAVGDWNESYDDLVALSKGHSATLARGQGVDHALVDGATVVTTRVLPKGGSDHHPILYTLDVDGHRATLLNWNVYVGQRPSLVRRRLRRLIRRHRPNVITLQEAYRCGSALARLADARGYHLVQGRNVGEGADCATLVRRDGQRLTGHGWMRMRQRWAHKRPKSPRVYPRVRIRLAPGVALRVLNVHQPSKRAANATARDESRRRIARWLTAPQHASSRQKEHR